MTTKFSKWLKIRKALSQPATLFCIVTLICAAVLLFHLINIHSDAIKTRVSIKLHNGTNWIAATLPKGIYNFYISTNGNVLQTISGDFLASKTSVREITVNRNSQIIYNGLNETRGRFPVNDDSFFDIIIIIRIEIRQEETIYFNCGRPE